MEAQTTLMSVGTPTRCSLCPCPHWSSQSPAQHKSEGTERGHFIELNLGEVGPLTLWRAIPVTSWPVRKRGPPEVSRDLGKQPPPFSPGLGDQHLTVTHGCPFSVSTSPAGALQGGGCCASGDVLARPAVTQHPCATAPVLGSREHEAAVLGLGDGGFRERLPGTPDSCGEERHQGQGSSLLGSSPTQAL